MNGGESICSTSCKLVLRNGDSMTKKKNIPASSQNVYSPGDGQMNSENAGDRKLNATGNFDDDHDHIKNAGVYSGPMNTRNKK